MKFKDQVAYICVDCKKGFRRNQLTPVIVSVLVGKDIKIFGYKIKKARIKFNKLLKCNNCIEKSAILNKALWTIMLVISFTFSGVSCVTASSTLDSLYSSEYVLSDASRAFTQTLIEISI